MINKRVQNAVLDLSSFKGKPFNITVIQVDAPTTDAEESEIGQIYEELEGLIKLTPKKMVYSSLGIGMQK